MAKPTTVAEYIKSSPKESQKMLRELRALLKKVVPKATESLKWGTPVFEEKRILFAYAAYKTHINFMPTPSSLKPFKKEVEKFVVGKSTLQLPYGKPLPKALIKKIAAFRAKELREKDVRWM